eukprot:NODE_834_length_1612_cov_62.320539_g824_i0.p1 GENE.NODE_834_length_1612_cov_62.320539_g824_i0~~NODE_834_length_1612_cov_62.320539_g824_i0.p1  ORF type:complete len:360 (+),score=51.78 NODE_834_length_1612_cov_62.320539_g824_i0:80-1081(+)
MRDTEQLRKRLRKTLTDCQEELEKLDGWRDKLTEKVQSGRRLLEATLTQIDALCQGPVKENVVDFVRNALDAEATDLKFGVEQMHTLLRGVDQHYANLSNLEQGLFADLEDKTRSQELDRQCLGLHPGTPAKLPSPPGSPQLTQSRTPAGLPSMDRSERARVLPEAWKRDTMTLLDESDHALLAGSKLRSITGRTSRELDNGIALHSEQVINALKLKIQQSTKLHTKLTNQLNDLKLGIAVLESERKKLKLQLEEKQGPISIVQERLRLRQQRPNREAVRDAAEEALEEQMLALQASSNELTGRLNNTSRVQPVLLQMNSSDCYSLNPCWSRI